jgi:hypothetical protein
MPLSWNEIRIRAAQFSEEWKDETSESGEKQTFWNQFFNIFGVDRRRVAVYEQQVRKLSGASGFIDLFWPGELVVEHKSHGEPLDPAFDQAADYLLSLSPEEHPRYVITSDFRTIRLYDLAAAGDTNMLQISLKDLPQKVDHFSFIAGYRKQEIHEEDPVNRKAAERLAELHDQLKNTGYGGHDLEVLLVRILFCLFAEDSLVFGKNQFHDFIYNRTDIDGSDLGAQLNQLFEVLNTAKSTRQTNLDESLHAFPYVNGKLFEERIAPASFDHRMRDRILDAAHDMNWSEISPAIFGAMFQSVMDPEKRRNLGAHYTSEHNILKAIKPLFLDSLWGEFEIAKDNQQVLNEFHKKIASLKFLDPACGCGNFLVVSYREIRRLELSILKKIYTVPGLHPNELELDLEAVTKCNVDQFYGIEIEEFPAQIAQVALWLTDVQANNEASDYFGKPLVRLPLLHSPSIINSDALDTEWTNVIEPTKLDYLLGNPPFAGKQLQTDKQKAQIELLFEGHNGAGNLDYVSGWYVKAIKYIQGTDIKVAFVSTNSITQGEQVSILWSYMLERGTWINFAHKTFRWSNEGSGSAGVYCIILGFWLEEAKHKQIFEYVDVSGEPHAKNVDNINPYLVDAPNILVKATPKPLSNVPEMVWGSKPVDDGNFILNDDEKMNITKNDPVAAKYIKPLLSTKEYLNGETRWCLWLKDASPSDIRSSKILFQRVQNVRSFRQKSKKAATQEAAQRSTEFAELRQPDTTFIVVPLTTSENRLYVPLGFFDEKYIVNNSVSYLPHASYYEFGILESEMHMVWMRYVCGRLEGRYRYSNTLVYNNFPWPSPNSSEKEKIAELGREIIKVRDSFKDNSLADLYDPIAMPVNLLRAHRSLDQAVDSIYRKKRFTSESERMNYLLKKYQNISA